MIRFELGSQNRNSTTHSNNNNVWTILFDDWLVFDEKLRIGRALILCVVKTNILSQYHYFESVYIMESQSVSQSLFTLLTSDPWFTLIMTFDFFVVIWLVVKGVKMLVSKSRQRRIYNPKFELLNAQLADDWRILCRVN